MPAAAPTQPKFTQLKLFARGATLGVGASGASPAHAESASATPAGGGSIPPPVGDGGGLRFGK